MKINTISPFLLAILLGLAASAPAHARGDDGDDTAQAEQSQPIAANVAGSYLASQFARNNGDTQGAIRALRRVHRNDPANTSIAIQLQGMLLIEGKIAEATTLAADITQAGAKEPLSELLQVLQDVKVNDLDSAAQTLEVAAENPNVQLWVPLISAWVDSGRDALKNPVSIDELNLDAGRATPLVNYHLALINSRAGFNEAAAQNFKDAIEDPRDPPVRILRQLLKFYDKHDAPKLLDPIVNAYYETHPGAEMALKSDGLTPVITTPRDGIAEILYTMGGIMFGAGVINDATIYLQLAVYVKPDLSEAIVALGDAYGELRQYERSNQYYAKIAPDDPLYSRAQLHIAVNYDRMGNLKKSLALLDKMLKRSPDAAEIMVTKGDLLRIHARYAEAVDAYTRALEHIAASPEPRVNVWPIYFARGSCLERQGKWPEAEKDLEQALVLKPDQPDVLNYLGFSRLEHGETIGESRQMIAKAVKARPNDAQIIDSMGWVLYLQGDYQEAMSYLERALEILPSDPTINDHLGDAYWRLGRENEARFQWQRSLTYAPEQKLADSIHKKLADGLPPATIVNTASSGKPVVEATP